MNAKTEYRPSAESDNRQLEIARQCNADADRMIWSDPEFALARLVISEKISRELGDNELLAFALMTRARVYLAQARIDGALAVCREAIACASLTSNLGLHAETLARLGSIWASIGLGEEGLPYLDQAAELLLESPDSATLALVRSITGGVLAQMGQFSASHQQLVASLGAFTELAMKDRIVETRHNLACLHICQDQFDEALSLSLQNVKDALQLNDLDLLAHIEATVVDALCGLGRHAEAIDYAKTAMARAHKDSRGQFDIMEAYAKTLDKAGQPDEGFRILKMIEEKSTTAKLPVNGRLLHALKDISTRLDGRDETARYEAMLNALVEHTDEQKLRMRMQSLQTNMALQEIRLRMSAATN
jgi:tetratricopeptide (TPR) repeat protein